MYIPSFPIVTSNFPIMPNPIRHQINTTNIIIKYVRPQHLFTANIKFHMLTENQGNEMFYYNVMLDINSEIR